MLYILSAPTTLLEGIRYSKPIPKPLAEAIGSSESFFSYFFSPALKSFEMAKEAERLMPCHAMKKTPGRHRARRIWRNEFFGSQKVEMGVENTHIYIYFVCVRVFSMLFQIYFGFVWIEVED